ncbi:FAS1 domain-containing protein, partial [Mrakia frigida]|uniref:FAS1 domain-containing protein n=1 Tax=Mrakia frigida TaxID=29902 RepID=UPI003FCC1B97
MRFSIPFLALALTSGAFAQDAPSAVEAATFASGLAASLLKSGLTTFLEIVTTIGSTPDGLELLGSLGITPDIEATILVPTNVAFTGVGEEVTGNVTRLAQVLSYHVLEGTFDASTVAVAPAHSIARTLLTGDEFAKVGEGRSQALVLSQMDGSIVVDAPFLKWDGRAMNISTGAVSKYANLTIIALDEVLNLPPTIGAYATVKAASVAGALTTVGLVAPLEAAVGITAFLPTDSAFAALPADVVAALTAEELTTILSNHVVAGSVLYSTNIGQSDAFSLAGQQFTFALNGETLTVTSGDVTANVVTADIIVANGVVHLIDSVLVNLESSPEVAESVAAVAATASATVDAGVGPTPAAARRNVLMGF